MVDPVKHSTFIHADGLLAEFMCQVYLIELTPERAQQLLYTHREHHPDECVVHLQAAYLLLIKDGY
ncbi:hypothetical protein AB0M45_33165 [Nocardia sp. NPDC051787]|uniref:hypothetical protein n=1 Tax=Nocardia sp. NPDC051787 TaxID=3155415 RepID=UPI0034164080